MNRRALFLSVVLVFLDPFGSRMQAQCEVLDLHGPSVWQEGSQYGCSVDLDADRMAIGQHDGPYDWATGSSPGMVYLFRREPFGWAPDGLVQATDGEAFDYFGWSVALDGNRLLVGAKGNGSLGTKGAVYVYERQGDGIWLETAKLVPEEPQALATGWSVDLKGDTAIVGAKGATIGLGWGRVYVYEHVGGSWVMQQEILPSFSQSGDGFGVSVDLQGNRLVIGQSDGWTFNPPHPGRAYVFEKQSGLWTETALLTCADVQDGDLFGTGVALDGDTILVGAPGYDVSGRGIQNEGAVFSFELVGGAWVLSQTMLGEVPATAASAGMFGWDLDLEGDRAIVGSHTDPAYVTAGGAASYFERAQGAWSQVSKFGASEQTLGDTLGYSVDLEAEEILIGAPSAASDGTSPGTVYLFSLTAGPHLLADAGSISLSQGGTQTLSFGACPTHEGDLYFLAGSATGTSPGFVFAGISVPLNPDVYFFHTVNHPGAAPLAGSLGVFDAFGRAEASFALPAGAFPTLAGLVLHHAYAVLDGTTLQLEAISPAVAIALVP